MKINALAELFPMVVQLGNLQFGAWSLSYSISHIGSLVCGDTFGSKQVDDAASFLSPSLYHCSDGTNIKEVYTNSMPACVLLVDLFLEKNAGCDLNSAHALTFKVT